MGGCFRSNFSMFLSQYEGEIYRPFFIKNAAKWSKASPCRHARSAEDESDRMERRRAVCAVVPVVQHLPTTSVESPPAAEPANESPPAEELQQQ